MELIDKDVVLAEIERRINAYQKNFDKSDNKIARLSTDGRIAGLKGLLSFIDTLEVKEADLEKEKDDYWNKLCDSEFGELLERDAKWFDDIAKHFFELGMRVSNKVQKGE